MAPPTQDSARKLEGLFPYYQDEIKFLRELGAEFATQHREAAGRLSLSRPSNDPHVDRLIQSFAFLTARVRRKIDDELPEITESLLTALYPHFLNPIPSMSVIEFELDPKPSALGAGRKLNKHFTLTASTFDGSLCSFRTIYPIDLLPIEVVDASSVSLSKVGNVPQAARAGIRLRLRVLADGPVTPGSLRFFLAGSDAIPYLLYEAIVKDTVEVRVESGGVVVEKRPQYVLPSDAISPVGFAPDEGLLPYGPRSFQGYRLLQEYFCFPEKFLFFDLRLDPERQSQMGREFEILILFATATDWSSSVTKANFRLNCCPVINLFEKDAEPLNLDHEGTTYRVVPDAYRYDNLEVYSVEAVESLPEGTRYAPLYSISHDLGDTASDIYWYAKRQEIVRAGEDGGRDSGNQISGTEMFLSFLDLKTDHKLPEPKSLNVKLICFNRDEPKKLRVDYDNFQPEGALPGIKIHSLVQPTETLRPVLRKGAHWRLISHLSLNYCSLYDAHDSERRDGVEAFRELLTLYDNHFADQSDRALNVRKQVSGIKTIVGKQIVNRPSSMPWNGFCRGLEVTITLDNAQFEAGYAFLFASVLENFIGLYTSVNSFTQFVARVEDENAVVLKQWKWDPRAGAQILL